MRILHIIDRLDYSARSKQLTLLARGMPETAVCVLGADAGPATSRRDAGVAIHLLGRRHAFDLRSFGRLRGLMRDCRPDVITVWGREALRATAVARPRCPVIAADVLPPRARRLSITDRWLLHRATRVLVRGGAEARRGTACGLRAEKMALVPHVVENNIWNMTEELPALPPSARIILCSAAMAPGAGIRDTVWALEVLAFVFDEVHLLLAGDGPARTAMEHFTACHNLSDRVHFLGARGALGSLLARAEMVWVPSQVDTGLDAVLEGMVAGKPVIATRVPSLCEVIRHRENGLLIPPNDPVALAKCAGELLRDPEFAHQLGEAGRRQASAFSPVEFVNQFTRIYAEVA